MMRIKFLIIVLFIIAGQCLGQDRYIVFFTDKHNSPYAIERPQEFLSKRALDRRLKNSVFLDESDLPVNPSYVSQLKGLGIQTFFTSKWMNATVAQMTGEQANQVLGLSFVEQVEYVAPGILLEETFTQTDSESTINVSNSVNAPTAVQHEMLGVNEMHSDGIYGEGVLIGVFDDGFANLSRLPVFENLIDKGQVLYSKDYTTNDNDVENNFSHGTRVLSVLAGDDGNYLGVAPDAQYILSVTEASGEYRIEEYNWLFAIEQADSAGVDIVNTSLGYTQFTDSRMSYVPSQMDGMTTVISRAAQMAVDKGILLVNAAGNGGRTAWRIVSAPADVVNVLSVGAISSNGTLAFFSSVGPNAAGFTKPDVVALGSGTAVVDADGLYKFQNGTSFSSPLVAGLAAGLLSEYPELTRAELFDLILRSGNVFENPNNSYGSGLPNYQMAKELLVIDKIPEGEKMTLFPNPASNGFLDIAFGEDFVGLPVDLQVIDSNGKQILNHSMVSAERVTRLDVGQYLPGIYLVRAQSTNGSAVKKLLIQY